MTDTSNPVPTKLTCALNPVSPGIKFARFIRPRHVETVSWNWNLFPQRLLCPTSLTIAFQIYRTVFNGSDNEGGSNGHCIAAELKGASKERKASETITVNSSAGQHGLNSYLTKMIAHDFYVGQANSLNRLRNLKSRNVMMKVVVRIMNPKTTSTLVAAPPAPEATLKRTSSRIHLLPTKKNSLEELAT